MVDLLQLVVLIIRECVDFSIVSIFNTVCFNKCAKIDVVLFFILDWAQFFRFVIILTSLSLIFLFISVEG